MSLSSLFTQSLVNASKAANGSTLDEATQQLLYRSMKDLSVLQGRIDALGLFSPNETLDDISTRNLVYLSVPYVKAEIQNRIRTLDPDERIASLGLVKEQFRQFVTTLDNYGIVGEEDKDLYGRDASAVSNPTLRRELKIKQYKREKELKGKLEVLRKKRRQSQADPSNDFDLISSLLPAPSASTEQESDSEDESDSDEAPEGLRATILLLLRFLYTQCQSQQSSIAQELDLLRQAPREPSTLQRPDQDRREREKEKEKDMWKLDNVGSRGASGSGALLDSEGKPLRPFTILPAGASDRAKLQARVFAPDHALPTMSVDEYLAIEAERGKFISGGGKASEGPTESEQLAIAAEADGTLEGMDREEQKRQKDEKWARFTDENPRGAGNTMNRG